MTKKRKGTQKKSGAGGDPFAARPIVAENVRAKADSLDLLQLRMELKPKPGIASFLARWCGLKRDARINLDKQGTFFWRQIDGAKTLGEIEILLRDEFALSKKDSARATMLFTKMLMLRHLIWLKVDKPKGAAADEDSPHVIH